MGLKKELHPDLLESGALKMKMPDKSVFSKGKDLFLNGFASVIDAQPYEVQFIVEPPGDPVFKVYIRSGEKGVSAFCQCAYHGNKMNEYCPHLVAAVLEYHDYCQMNDPVTWRSHLQNSIQPFTKKSEASNFTNGLESRTAVGAFLLQSASMYSANAAPQYRVDFILINPGSDLDSEDILSQPEMVPSWLKSGNLTFQVMDSRQLKKVPCWNWDEQLEDTLQFLGLVNGGGYKTYFLQRDLNLLFSRFLPEQLLFLGDKRLLQKALNVVPRESRLALRIEDHPKEEGLLIRPQIFASDAIIDLNSQSLLEPICETPGWYVAQDHLFRLDADPGVLSLWRSKPEIEVAADEEKELLEWFIPRLADHYEITGSAIQWSNDPQPLSGKRLYLFEDEGELRVEPRWMYGEFEIAPSDLALGKTVMAPHPENHRRIQKVERELNKEAAWAAELKEFGLKNSLEFGVYALRAKVTPMDFLMVEVPKLIQSGFEIHGENELEKLRVNRNQPVWRFNVSYGVDWMGLDSDVAYGDSRVSLAKILSAIRKKQRFVQLADGSMGQLPEEWIEKIRKVLDLGEMEDGELKLSKAHTLLVSEMMDAEGIEGNASEEFYNYRNRIRDLHSIPEFPVPKNFKGKLFDYQHAGLKWLRFLHDSDFSGLLADDMGVGKTIQTLCFLLSLQAENKEKDQPRCSLLVAPRSLVNNWQREAAKFAPSLKVLPHWDGKRGSDPEEFKKYDLVITTYGMMRQDIGWLEAHPFHYVILDESQVIKNPTSESFKAARHLRSKKRLCLTGTPVENRTLDLWSQFSFLNPGYLGGATYFRDRFANPIEKDQNEDTADLLRKLVFPFILRRTKDQVALELPPRTVKEVWCELTPSQNQVYQEYRDQYRDQLLSKIQGEGVQKNQMKIIEALLRLRQISNHPKLVEKQYPGDSGKMDSVLETMETLVEENHKALVFSSFTGMLKLLQREMIKRKWKFLYLDGKTQNRQQLVDQYQTDDSIPFFLISLKAGGAGLNLTAADYVLHVDPWWNPAAENQASDRAHRIGQTRPVFVYKFLMKDSVEDKILELQNRKQKMVSQLVSSEKSFFKNLTEADVDNLLT